MRVVREAQIVSSASAGRGEARLEYKKLLIKSQVPCEFFTNSKKSPTPICTLLVYLYKNTLDSCVDILLLYECPSPNQCPRSNSNSNSNR